MADAAETAARAMAESASEDENDGDGPQLLDEDADEVVIDDDSLYDGDVCHPSVAEPAIDVSNGSSGLGFVNSPRSVLKGTATAASTKRRQDAIVQLIQSAVNRSKSNGGSISPSEENSLSTQTLVTSTTATSSDPSSSSGSASGPLFTNGITWLLASDLYDCHTQLSKLQSQMRVLEQRLTAQEAAADEAIERLCLQCRHVEYELNEARQRLQAYLEEYQQNNTTRAEKDYSLIGDTKSDALRTILSNGNNAATESNTQLSNDGVPMNGSINTPIHHVPPSAPSSAADAPQTSVNAISPDLSIWSSNDLGTELASLALKTLDPTQQSAALNDGWNNGGFKSSFDPVLYSPEPLVKNGPESISSTPGKSSPNADNSEYLRGPQQRVRLTNFGALARRRPPTRVVVDPPLIVPPGVELNTIYSMYSSPSVKQNADDQKYIEISKSDGATESHGSPQFLPELLIRSGLSEPHVATPTPPVNPLSTISDSVVCLVESEQLVVEAQPLLTLISPSGSPTLGSDSKHKRFGVELPGLSSANQVVLRHREISESSPPVSAELSAAEVRRQANMALLSSLKGVPRPQ
ncbi:hypothetical protein FGIG_01646 [Fasciola gigantica]|uniref:Uncharacterized protein n=1 Tax=Fasciola gigantica TaxID=46835 RepID=A0A504Y6N3_FASGI|nr:hypothetical protein FGIG_01646 [Fasciola gigantica]